VKKQGINAGKQCEAEKKKKEEKNHGKDKTQKGQTSNSQPKRQSMRIGTGFPMRREHKGYFAASDAGGHGAQMKSFERMKKRADE